MSTDTAIDRFYEALARGDVDHMRGCCTPDSRFWHNFDGIAQDLDVATKSWAGLVTYTAERQVADVRRRALPDGYLQQHLFVLRTGAGEQKSWAVCIIVTIANGLISRLEEYIDRAGSFTLADDAPIVTPGLPKHSSDSSLSRSARSDD